MENQSVDALIERAAFRASARYKDAKRAGYPVDGAEFIAAEGLQQKRCLVVRPGQVEFLSHRMTGYYETKFDRVAMAMADVTSVTVIPKGATSALLEVAGTTGGISLKTDLDVAYLGEQIINKHRTSIPGTSAPAEDPLHTLRSLKSMLEESLITDEEYQTKKAEILRRM